MGFSVVKSAFVSVTSLGLFVSSNTAVSLSSEVMVTVLISSESMNPGGGVISFILYSPVGKSLVSAYPLVSVVMVSTSLPEASRTSNTAPARPLSLSSASSLYTPIFPLNISLRIGSLTYWVLSSLSIIRGSLSVSIFISLSGVANSFR